MNLAIRDVRRHAFRFIATAAGLGLLMSVVMGMQGIYAGMVDDATILTRAMDADLWVVQRDTRGPFAENSRLDPSVEHRVAAIPGVIRARPYTYQLLQRERAGEVLRIALVGLGWPDDNGEGLPLIRGRALAQPHGEIIADVSLGLSIGDTLTLARESYRVVGLTKNALTSGGDSVAFLTVTDAQLIAYEQPEEAIILERQRTIDRLRRTELGRRQPALEDLVNDPRWRPPAISSPPLAAVLVTAVPHRLDEVKDATRSWGDVRAYTQEEEESFLLGGVVKRARMQIGLFTVILTLTASVIVAMVIYNLTLEKTHDLAVLKLLGAPRARLLGFVLQQAWLLGALAYAFAYVIGALLFPIFPRRVVITEIIATAVPIAAMSLVTLASIIGLIHVQRIDPARALEG
ncbi:MAG: ABC transporter permease [Deltaproteobacteria bacterium]|nr:ABC transporter permease [Deltaproteobacteria bacterium]